MSKSEHDKDFVELVGDEIVDADVSEATGANDGEASAVYEASFEADGAGEVDANQELESGDSADQVSDEATTPEAEKAKRVLRAVEHILSDDESIIGLVNSATAQVDEELAKRGRKVSEKTRYRRIGRRIIRFYTNFSSLAGAVTGLPVILPGIGSLVGFVGASLVDTVATLKLEVEMSLALCHLAGFDISNPRDRQIAFTLASVTSYEVRASDDILVDGAQLSAAAFWDYSSRQMSKYLGAMIAKRILISSGKHLTKFVPFVGMAVGFGLNRTLTRRTGNQCLDALWLRRPRANAQQREEAIDATFKH